MLGPCLEFRAVHRNFGALRAVSDLSLALRPGELHALVGENGAGKSTALRMLAGHVKPSAGEILVDGQVLEPAAPLEAFRRGIGMVHQHFMLVDRFTALENLILGSEPTGPLGTVDLGRALELAHKVGREAGLEVPWGRRASELTVGERQRLEILRVLFRGARAILLDEPTAVLAPLEVADLYAMLRKLAQGGATVVVVSHRLDEVARYCDVVSVMRRGRLVLHEKVDRKSTTGAERTDSELRARLTRAIMGGEPPAEAHCPELGPSAKPALQVSGLTLGREGEPKVLDNLSLTLRRGEILGVAGVEGNGQRELARVLAGLDAPSDGLIELDSRALGRGRATSKDHGQSAQQSSRVHETRALGLVVVHEDRQREELLLEASVWDNLVLGDLGTLNEKERVPLRFARFDIHPADPARLAAELSGGNQQKLVMARALDRQLCVLVLAQPTRGVDVGTARTIHHAISQSAAQGVGVILISADLNELRTLCHRIVVMRRGRLVAELGPDATDETIGRAMLGTEET